MTVVDISRERIKRDCQIQIGNRLKQLSMCKKVKNMELYWQLHALYASMARKSYLTRKVSKQNDFFD